MLRNLISQLRNVRTRDAHFSRTPFSFTARRAASSTRTWGNTGEEIARRYLERSGIRVSGHNIHKRFGEIDLVGEEGRTTVFFEVKMRTSNNFGTPEDALTRRKLSRVIKAAQLYSLHQKINFDEARIDLLAIDFDPQHSRGEIRHYRGVGLT